MNQPVALTRSSQALRRTVMFGALIAALGVLGASPAHAGGGKHNGHDRHGRYERHERYDRHWGHDRHYRPVRIWDHGHRRVIVVPRPVYYRPPVVVYRQPQVVYASPPGVNFVFPLNVR